MRISFGSRCLAVLLLQTGLWSCTRVHYRHHEFDAAEVPLPGSGTARVVLAGRFVAEDSAGLHIERLGAPYSASVYADSSIGADAAGLTLTLIGAESGDTISVELSPPEMMEGDTLGRLVATASHLVLPYQDYLAVLETRTRGADRSDSPRRVGRLNRRLSQSSAFGFWEKLMSV
jgi:hypothetical protein